MKMPKKPRQAYTPKQSYLSKQDYRIPQLKKQIYTEKRKLKKLQKQLKEYE